MRARPASVTALGLVAALLLSGCGLADARRAAAANAAVTPVASGSGLRPGLVGLSDYPSTGWDPGSAAASAPTLPAKNPLAAVGLRASDFSGQGSVSVIPDGNSLGIPTLDFCEGKYPSESLRLKRLQVGAFDAKGQYAGISTEVVVYESPAAAKQALQEVIAARLACPVGKVVKTYDGHTLVFAFHPAPGPSSTPLVGADSRLIIHTTMQVDGKPQTAFLVYQVDGPVLAGLYATASTGKPFDQSSLDKLYGLAGDIADRLRAYVAKLGTAA